MTFLLLMAVTPVLIARSRQWGLLDQPGPRKIHLEPTPLAGGIVFFPLVLLALLSGFYGDEKLTFLIIAIGMIFAVGLLDDYRGVHFFTKFLVQITAALLVMQAGIGFDLNNIHVLQGLGVHFGPFLSTVVTIGWIVGITNAVNLIDGMDGLASGLCLNAFVAMGALAIIADIRGLGLCCAIMSGGILGFLRYNLPPARTFLGDSGSLLLGFFLSVASIVHSARTTTFLVLVIPVLLLGIPMTDTAIAFFRRTTNGHNPFKPDRGHLHHRLLDLNFTVGQTLGLFYSLSTGLGILALLLAQTGSAQVLALALLLLVVPLAAVRAMRMFDLRDLVQKVNNRMRTLAKKASGGVRSGEERLGRNFTLLAFLCLLNLALILKGSPATGPFAAAIAGLFAVGVLDVYLNRREEEPKFEVLHTVLFLSFVLNQLIILAMSHADYSLSPYMGVWAFVTLGVVAWFLFRTGTFAAFLKDPVEVLDLFMGIVAAGMAKHYLGAPSFLPFAVVIANALALYTVSKVYLTGYWIRSRVIFAGVAVGVVALVGVTWI